jgi:predicted ATP-grasp superfamily ATP-dependent carboligase
VRDDPPSGGDDRQWLLKPLRGSGGIGVRQYRERAWFDPRTHYLQGYIPGSCFSAVFLGLQSGRALLIGVTWLIQPKWLHAPPFHYCGNVLSRPGAASGLQKIGDVLADTFALRGLFGVDFVVGSAGFWVMEVNPRYTASVEVLERAFSRPLLDLHRTTLEGLAVDWPLTGPSVFIGKAVLYAPQTLVFPEVGPWSFAFAAPCEEVEYADVPHAGETVPRGQPVLTLFASAPTEAQCLQALHGKVQALDRCLWG